MDAMSANECASLRGRRVLIVEDEMLVAMELASLVRAEGCVVLGPAPTNERALALIEEERPEACLLDVNLGGELATPVARELTARSVPFALVTGYSVSQTPEPELRDAPRLAKPLDERMLLRVLCETLSRA